MERYNLIWCDPVQLHKKNKYQYENSIKKIPAAIRHNFNKGIQIIAVVASNESKATCNSEEWIDAAKKVY